MKRASSYVFFIVTLLVMMSFMSTAQWVQTSGPDLVGSFAIKGSNIFAGSRAGVYLSTDNGINWTGVNDGLTDQIVFALSVQGSNLIAGTMDSTAFVSTDNGTHWKRANTGLLGPTVYVFAAIGSTLFAGADPGVFRSTDNGFHWAAADSGLISNYFYTLAVSPNGKGGSNLFAGAYAGVFISTDTGAHWTVVNNGLTDRFGVLRLAVKGSTIFAGTYYSGIFRSTNNGAEWTNVKTVHTGHPVSALCVIDSNIFAGIYKEGIFVSGDNGAHWRTVDIGFPDTTIYVFKLIGSDLFVGTRQSVWKCSLSQILSVPVSATDLPMSFSLAQNYPNPFNPVTRIRFSLPAAGMTSLIVYDIFGREVATLVKERLEAGDHETGWNGASVASGAYLYRLSSYDPRYGMRSYTKKMALVK